MIKKGDYIHKKNFDLIGKRKGLISVQVKSIYSRGKFLVINGSRNFLKEHIQVVSKQEAERINELFLNTSISKTSVPETNSSCYREDNGEPKKKFSEEFHVLQILFKFRMLKPEGHFEAYKCPECGYYHIGKTKQNGSKN